VRGIGEVTVGTRGHRSEHARCQGAQRRILNFPFAIELAVACYASGSHRLCHCSSQQPSTTVFNKLNIRLQFLVVDLDLVDILPYNKQRLIFLLVSVFETTMVCPIMRAACPPPPPPPQQGQRNHQQCCDAPGLGLEAG
jgi:hypothetical protein